MAPSYAYSEYKAHVILFFLCFFGCVFWGSAYLPFSYRHYVKSLPFSLSLLGDVTDKVRIVFFMRLVLFVLIFVSLVIYVNAYFLIDRSRTSLLSVFAD